LLSPLKSLVSVFAVHTDASDASVTDSPTNRSTAVADLESRVRAAAAVYRKEERRLRAVGGIAVLVVGSVMAGFAFTLGFGKGATRTLEPSAPPSGEIAAVGPTFPRATLAEAHPLAETGRAALAEPPPPPPSVPLEPLTPITFERPVALRAFDLRLPPESQREPAERVKPAAMVVPPPAPAPALPSDLAFLLAVKRPDWSYATHLKRFATSGVIFTFAVPTPEGVVSVPFPAHDHWRRLLRELEEAGELDAEQRKAAETFVAYQRFVLALPRMQQAGIYVEGAIIFEPVEESAQSPNLAVSQIR